ncbi:MAG: hypothetical protein RLY49_163 [Candidatus Parcubacteria bacterium]|jgi:uncharacterized membrane protein
MILKKLLFTILLLVSFSENIFAQEVYEEYKGTYNAKITQILNKETREIWDGTQSAYKKIEVKLLDGPQKGETKVFETDFPEIKKGLNIYINHYIYIGGEENFSITNINRKNQIYFFIGLFILATILLGGKQGIRSLLSLVLSFLVIFYILLPGILHGWNPLIASFLVASIILFFAIFFTHGWNKESLIAFCGTMFSVLLTSIFAIIAVKMTHLSGFTTDESTYLYFNTKGALDFSGLLLGAIIIGVLGVLDDIAVTQAAIVTELYDSNPKINPFEVYKRAMRVGREHVGALVNTLVLAYTGTALPLLLLFKTREYSFTTAINLEVFTTEIIRTIIGSIGLMMTVPIVTLLSVYFLRGYTSKNSHSHKHHHHH